MGKGWWFSAVCILLRFSACKYIISPSLRLSPSLPLPLSVSVCAWGKPQGLSAASSLKALFHFQDRAGLQYGHCLYTNVALGIMFISITVLKGRKKRKIGMQSLSAHIAFHEIMPLQECFEDTDIFPNTSIQPAVIHQLSSHALSPWRTAPNHVRSSFTW